MSRWLSGLFFLACLSCGSAQSPQAQRPEIKAKSEGTEIPGSRLDFWLPEGAKRFSRTFGYRRTSPALIVIAAEMTVEASETEAAMKGASQSALKRFTEKSRGMRGSAREVVYEGELKGLTTQMLVLGDKGALATIVVSYEEGSKQEAARVLSSVRIRPDLELDPLKLHFLRIDSLGEFSVDSGMSQPVVLLHSSAVVPPEPATPSASITVQPHNKGADLTDKELGQFIGKAIKIYSPDFDKVKTNEQTIDGQATIELILPGKKDGIDVVVYTYGIRDGDGGVLVAVGTVGVDRIEAELPKLQATLRSIRRDAIQ